MRAREDDVATTATGPGTPPIRAPQIAFLVWSVLLTGAYFALPRWHMVLWAALGSSSALAILVGVRRHRPARRLPWLLLAAGICTFAAGDLSYNVLTLVLHQDNPFPSIADGFYLLMYPLCATALAVLIRTRTPSADRSSLIDALIITAGLAMLSWIYLIQPFVRSGDLTLDQKVISVAYPLADVLLLAMLVRLLTSGGARARSAQLLTAATIGLLVSDVLYGLIQLDGTWQVGGPVDLGWVVFYVLLGAAALDPSMSSLTRPVPRLPAEFHGGRLLLIAAASLIAPADSLVQSAIGRSEDAPVRAGFSAVLFSLVIARLWLAVQAHRRSLEAERLLREVSASLVSAADVVDVDAGVARALETLSVDGSPLGCQLMLCDGDRLYPASRPGAEIRLARLSPGFSRALAAGSGTILSSYDVEACLPISSSPELSWLVLPLRSGTSTLGVLMVSGDAGRLAQRRGALETLALNVVLVLARIAMADTVHQRVTEAHFRALIQNASDVILVVAADYTITYQTPSATCVLGYEPEHMADLSFLSLVHPDDRGRALGVLELVREHPNALNNHVDWRMRRADDSWLDAEVVCSNLLDDPDVRGIVLTLRDVTIRRHLERELKHRAFHDSLTGLANRSLFADRLGHALSRAARTGALVGVLFIDLDDFKAINDTRGHSVGDDVLVEVSRFLVDSVRTGDTAARLGGDEFALLLEDVPSLDELEALANRLLGIFREPVRTDCETVFVRASIGIATNEHSTDAAQLLQLADLALYEAKDAYKGGYRIFRESLREGVHDRLERRDQIQKALENNDFQLFYQPIVAIATGEVVGVEALVRWLDPVRGMVPPDEFIVAAEESGLIVPLGEWVLREAVAQACRWQQATARVTPLRMSVNVSARQFREPGFTDMVRDVLAQSPLAPGSLVLEITESLLIHEEGVNQMLAELREAGVRLALDDFGTGYSALGYLSRFPIDILKLDKSFVDDLLVSRDRDALVDAIIHLARTLDLDLVVEGIETQAQCLRLREMGCELGQGFLFSRPQPPEAIEELLASALGDHAAAALAIPGQVARLR